MSEPITKESYDRLLNKLFKATPTDRRLKTVHVFMKDGWVFGYNSEGGVTFACSEITYKALQKTARDSRP